MLHYTGIYSEEYLMNVKGIPYFLIGRSTYYVHVLPPPPHYWGRDSATRYGLYYCYTRHIEHREKTLARRLKIIGQLT
jgi:hypothetical protein